MLVHEPENKSECLNSRTFFAALLDLFVRPPLPFRLLHEYAPALSPGIKSGVRVSVDQAAVVVDPGSCPSLPRARRRPQRRRCGALPRGVAAICLPVVPGNLRDDQAIVRFAREAEDGRAAAPVGALPLPLVAWKKENDFSMAAAFLESWPEWPGQEDSRRRPRTTTELPGST